MENTWILDVQGFQLKDSQFVCKELALIHIYTGHGGMHTFFKLPVKFEHLQEDLKRHARFLTARIHGLTWDKQNAEHFLYHHDARPAAQQQDDDDDQEPDYANLCALLRNAGIDEGSQIIVKGLQKKKWLNDVLPNISIINIEDMGCPALATLNSEKSKSYHCNKHAINNLLCAYQNAYLIRDWIETATSPSSTAPPTRGGGKENWGGRQEEFYFYT